MPTGTSEDSSPWSWLYKLWVTLPRAVIHAIGRKFNPRTNKGRIALVLLICAAAVWWKKYRADRAARRALARQRWRKALQSRRVLADIKRAGFVPGRFLQLPVGQVHYLLQGPPKGPVIMFLHGFGVFSYVYHQLMDPLTAQGFRVLAFDFYGFGWSTTHKDVTYNADLFVQQIADVLTALDIAPTPVIVVAHSMGGLMGTLFTNRFPQLVNRLMLLAPAGLPVQGYSASLYMSLIHSAKSLVELPFVGDAITQVLVTLISTQVKAAVRIGMNKRTLSYNTLCQTPRALSRVTSSLDVRQIGGRFVGMLDMTAKGLAFQQQHNPDFWRTLCETLANLDLFGDWVSSYQELGQRHADIPMLVCWGDSDEFLPYHNCEKFLKPALPHATFVDFPDADHFMFLNSRDDFMDQLIAFASSAPSPSTQ